MQNSCAFEPGKKRYHAEFGVTVKVCPDVTNEYFLEKGEGKQCLDLTKFIVPNTGNNMWGEGIKKVQNEELRDRAKDTRKRQQTNAG